MIVALMGSASFLGQNLVGLFEDDPHIERIVSLDVRLPVTAGAKTRHVATDLTTPGTMIDAVIEYLFEEASERPSHGMPIVVGTMATYMQSLANALDKRAVDQPLELMEREWDELYHELKHEAEKRGFEFDPSPFRRFARYWKLQSASVPGSIFSKEEKDVALRAEYSTASRIVWDHEWTLVTSMVLGGLIVGSAQYDISRVLSAASQRWAA